jgi:hypothetical protein
VTVLPGIRITLPDEADASKRRIFGAAAQEESLLLGMHFAPPPSLGRVVARDEGWQWRPIIGQ